MTSKKNRHALVSSIISLVLCCSMLIGTTFAWFTDTVTSENNIIKSGTLDVEMSWSNTKDGEYTDASKGAIFNYQYWEPGYTEVKFIKIENRGDLAFKYQLNILPTILPAVGDANLADVIEAYLVPAASAPADRAAVDAYMQANTGTTLSALIAEADGAAHGIMLPADGVGSQDYKLPEDTYDVGSATYCVILHMQEEAGNEYQNLSVGEGFKVRLNATQMTYEKDSFDSEYDTDSTYTTPEVWLNGEKLDYQGGPLTVAGGTLKLKDVTIAADSGVSTLAAEAEANALTITGDTELTVEGDVEIRGAKGGHGIFVAEGVKLTITGTGSLTAIGNNGKEYEPSGNYTNDASAADYEGTGGSGIGGEGSVIVIDGLKNLKAEGYGQNGFGIGGNGADVTISDTTVLSARGGFVNVTGQYNDEKYNKSEPEGGAAIGGKTVTIEDSRIVKAIGGSKAAGIGARFWQGAEITITNSTVEKVTGGASSAGIGGSRVSNGATEDGVTITITDSTINAQGGYFGAGIGSGYDTHTQSNQPLCTINITDSTITAVGGKYAAGVGTGYHTAALTGEIKNSTVNATSGEKFYKAEYSNAMDIGFGIVNPAREGQQDGSILYNGTKIVYTFEVDSAASLMDAVTSGKTGVAITEDIEVETPEFLLESTGEVNFAGNGNTITTNGVGAETGEYGYVAFIPAVGEDAVVSDVTVTGAGFVEIGHWGMGGGDYVANNLVVKDLVSTLANGDKGKTLACGFCHYGNAVLNDCTMTGTTAMVDGVMPVDAGFVNDTTTTVNGGEYGVIYCWSHAVVTIDGAEIDTLYVAPIKGTVTIKANTHVETLRVDYGTSSANADRLAKLVIEEGAVIDAIVYGETTYTVAQWNEYVGTP